MPDENVTTQQNVVYKLFNSLRNKISGLFFKTPINPKAIKLKTIPRPLPIDNGKYHRHKSNNNSLPYVILSEAYGLRDENLTIDLDSLIRDAEERDAVVKLPMLEQFLLMMTNDQHRKDFFTINYYKQFSSTIESEVIEKFRMADMMFRHPDKTLYIYNEDSFGDGIKFYQFQIRHDLDNLDEVILGEDLIIFAIDLNDNALTTALNEHKAVSRIFRGVRRNLYQTSRLINYRVNPLESVFSSIVKTSEEEEEKVNKILWDVLASEEEKEEEEKANKVLLDSNPEYRLVSKKKWYSLSDFHPRGDSEPSEPKIDDYWVTNHFDIRQWDGCEWKKVKWYSKEDMEDIEDDTKDA